MSIETRKKRPRRLLPSLCRICMTRSSTMSNLKEFMDPEETVSILGALEKVMACEIITTGELPDHVCSMCLSLLRISFNLKVQFEETQRKLFETSQEETQKEPDKRTLTHEPKTEVDIIYGKESYSLNDILIVEEDEERQYDLSAYLNNLDNTISVERVGKNIEESVLSDDNPEYETIVIQTESDVEETPQTFHWEHEYAKNSDIEGNGGRMYKDPEELREKLKSLANEGSQNSSESPETSGDNGCNGRRGRRKRCTNKEMEEIEKYIIYIGGDNEKKDNSEKIEETNNTEDDDENIKQTEMNSREISKIEEKVIIKDFLLNQARGKCTCYICKTTFVNKFTLKRHLRVVHKIVPLPCPKRKGMPKEVRARRRMEMMKISYKKNPMLCQICGFLSKSSGGARYHQLTHDEKKFQCDLCPRQFYTHSHLKHHKEYKHLQKPVKKHLCCLCGEYRNSSTALTYHMRLHTGHDKKFECHICSQKFLVPSALNTHMRRHKGERRFPCHLCSKAFYSTNEMRKHVMTHTGERPYKCHYCDKGFVTPFNRKIHMMTHDGAFPCQICQRSFIDGEVLNMHLKHKHHISSQDLNTTLTDDDDDADSNEAQILDGLDLLPLKDNLDFD